MKVIGIHTKYRVVEMFLNGYTLDEIVEQLPVSKGSVVSIISDFREGILQLPDHMTAYVDELRRLVVDMKKSGISLTQLKSYNRIYSKLQEMGADCEEAEGWLDICQDIASSTASDDRYYRMISDLVQLSLETGLNFRELIEDYHAKLTGLEELNRKIEQKNKGLNEIKVKHEKEKDKARKELASLTREIASTRNNFHKQRMDLQSQLDGFMSQNRLSWNTVNTVHAILKDKLNKAGVGEKGIAQISKEITTAGSLTVHLSKKQAKVKRLHQEEKARTSRIDGLKEEERKRELSVKGKEIARDFADDELKEKQKKLTEIDQVISDYIEDITASRLIIEFLASPYNLTTKDFDQLLHRMRSVRNQNAGIEYQESKIRDKFSSEMIMPRLSKRFEKYQANLEDAREQLAYYLVPILKDRVVFVSGYIPTRRGNPIGGLRRRL